MSRPCVSSLAPPSRRPHGHLTLLPLLLQIPFGFDNPYRIAHIPSMQVYGVAFLSLELDRDRAEERLSSSFKMLDHNTFERAPSFRRPCAHARTLLTRALALPALFSHSLQKNERATALASLALPSGEKVFVLGTGVVDPSQAEVHRGRVMVFGEDRVRKRSGLLAERDVAGGVYALCSFAGGIAASVNSRVSSPVRLSLYAAQT